MPEDAEEPTRDLATDLVRSLVGERQLLRELRLALEAQRRGVAENAPDAIELASRAVASAVHTLEQARRRRTEIVRHLAVADTVELAALERHVGPVAGLATARTALREEAAAVTRELALTQSVLQGAMRAGDAYLQALFGSVLEATPAYFDPSGVAPPAPPTGGALVNRRA